MIRVLPSRNSATPMTDVIGVPARHQPRTGDAIVVGSSHGSWKSVFEGTRHDAYRFPAWLVPVDHAPKRLTASTSNQPGSFSPLFGNWLFELRR